MVDTTGLQQEVQLLHKFPCRYEWTLIRFMPLPQSEQLSPVTASIVPPYLRCGKWRTGWCSEGGRGTGDSEKNISSSPVLEDGWRAMRLGLHIRTAAATAGQGMFRGGAGGERASVSAAREGYDSITFPRREAGCTVQGLVRPGSSLLRCEGPSCLCRTGTPICLHSWEVRVRVVQTR